MQGRLQLLRFYVLAVIFFTCGAISFFSVGRIVEALYVIAVYGWDAVREFNLHVVRDKPVLLVSNGDHATELITFLVGGCTIISTLILVFVSFNIIARLTGLLGCRTDILKSASTLSKQADANESMRTPVRILLPVCCLASSAGLIFLLVSQTLLHMLLELRRLPCSIECHSPSCLHRLANKFGTA